MPTPSTSTPTSTSSTFSASSTSLASNAAPGVPVIAKKRGKVPTRHALLKLAANAGGFDYKTSAHHALQRAGYVGTPKVVDELMAAALYIVANRRTREDRVVQARLGYLPKRVQSGNRRAPVLLPEGTPVVRLLVARTLAVKTMAKSVLRCGASGGHSMRVVFTSDASKVHYTVVMTQNHSTYAGAYKGWSANEDNHTITVPTDWRLRVERKGLADLGGMMTLDAHALVPDGDVRLYAATWVSQGRGYSVKVDRGFIAVLGEEHFHASSAQAASTGVRRKVKSAARVPAYGLSVEAFIARHMGCHLMVYVKDAEESGSCDYGIRSWCAHVGLDYNLGEAPLEDILVGFRMRPQDEVRRAVLHAVRRERSEQGALRRMAA